MQDTYKKMLEEIFELTGKQLQPNGGRLGMFLSNQTFTTCNLSFAAVKSYLLALYRQFPNKLQVNTGTLVQYQSSRQNQPFSVPGCAGNIP